LSNTTLSLARVAEAVSGAGKWSDLEHVFANPGLYDEHWWSVAWVVAGIWSDWVAVLSVNPVWANIPDAPGAGRLSYSDFQWRHTFRLPSLAIFGTGQRQFDNSDLDYDEANGRLLIRSLGGITEITVPADPGLPLSAVKNQPTKCLVSQAVGPRFQESQLTAPLCDPAKTFGGMATLGLDLLIAYWEFYNVVARDNEGLTATDASLDTQRKDGPWRAGPAGVNVPTKNAHHANKTHQRLLRVPPAWAGKYDPDAVIGCARQRIAGAFEGLFGPTLQVFKPDLSAAPGSDFGARMILGYPGTGALGWSEGYKNAEGDWWWNMAWPYDRNGLSVLIFGWTKGLGPNHYDDGIGCDAFRGWHSEPYTPMLYFYDPDQLGEVAMGIRQPWEVQPVQAIMPDWLWQSPLDGFDPVCRRRYFNGMTWDAAGERLFVLQTKAYGNEAVVHVLCLKGTP
jgi:hypothetical protein